MDVFVWTLSSNINNLSPELQTLPEAVINIILTIIIEQDKTERDQTSLLGSTFLNFDRLNPDWLNI